MITAKQATGNPELMIKYKDRLKNIKIFEDPWRWVFINHPHLYREFSDRYDEMNSIDIYIVLEYDSTLVLDLKNHLHKVNEDHFGWILLHDPELCLCMKYCNNPNKVEAAYYITFPHRLDDLNKEEKREMAKRIIDILREEKA